MYNQFKSFILAATLVVTISLLTTAARRAEPQVMKFNEQVLVTGLTVTPVSSTSVGLSWGAWAGSGNYTVTVLNLTTSQTEQQFTTSNTFASVINLTTGHTYRFSVDKAGYVITEDILM